jgi:hypothetical protein
LRSLEQIVREFPPRYASQIVLGSDEMYFLFLLPDGRIIGGEKLLDGRGRQKVVNHYEIMGVTLDETEDLTTLKSEFCSENQILRVDVAHGDLFVEIFKTLPTEAQWTAIATLYKQVNPKMIWDVWLGKEWTGRTDGTLSEFKRAVDTHENEMNRS